MNSFDGSSSVFFGLEDKKFNATFCYTISTCNDLWKPINNYPSFTRSSCFRKLLPALKSTEKENEKSLISFFIDFVD